MSPETDPLIDIADWVHRKNGYHRWNDILPRMLDLPLKYSDLVNVVTASPICSEKCPDNN